MNNNIIKDIGRSFIVSSLLPSSVFILLLTIILQNSIPLTQEQASSDLINVNSATTVTFTIWIAFALYSGQDRVVKLFEGYHLEILPLRWFNKRFKKKQIQKISKFKKEIKIGKLISEKINEINPDDTNQRLSRFKKRIDKAILTKFQSFELELPLEESAVLPTQFGNIFRAEELYAIEKYEMDSITIWPRLFHILPEKYLIELEEQNNRLIFLLNSSLLFYILSLLILILLLVNPFTSWIFLPSVSIYIFLAFGAFGFGYLTYWISIGTATDFSIVLRTGIDLYRFDLLVALNQELPDDYQEEKLKWSALSHFFVAGEELKSPEFWESRLNYVYRKELIEKSSQFDEDE